MVGVLRRWSAWGLGLLLLAGCELFPVRERIDEACLHTLVNGGHVHVVQAADLPAEAAVAAIFRF